MTELLQQLNAPRREERLCALRELKEAVLRGEAPQPPQTPFVNNHIHTTYSFSPYSPAKAAYLAWQNGLKTAGIMDHDSIAGAEEFRAAGEILGMPVTCGMELRVKMAHTAIGMRRINNPDQVGVAYVAMHGIPHDAYGEIAAFMQPYREARNRRNRAMVEKINTLSAPCGVCLDFDKDVLPLSRWEEGGSVTERHVLFALTQKILSVCPTPQALLAFLREKMGLQISEKAQTLLAHFDPALTPYDVLGVLKSNLVEKIYVDAADELPTVEEYIALCRRTGAISAYAYLGDVGDSVTGDKKAQAFEDGYLDLLFAELARLGFDAVTYMPTRNTQAQLRRVMGLCEQYGLFQISGEDINSPRQSFLCEKLTEDAFTHLIDATWALIGHEQAASADRARGMFSPRTVSDMPSLAQRIPVFARLAQCAAGKTGA